MIRQEQCNKVCRILDDVLANRPTERDSLIVAVQKAFDALEKQRWIPVTEIPPRGRDLMLKIHDACNSFFYYHMGFHDGKRFFTYNFSWEKDKDLEIVGWQLCPWEEGDGMITITYTYDETHPTNKDYLIAVLTDSIDDGGTSYESMAEYGIDCPYVNTSDCLNRHERNEYDSKEYREGCVRCKLAWLDREYDTYPSDDGKWEVEQE